MRRDVPEVEAVIHRRKRCDRCDPRAAAARLSRDACARWRGRRPASLGFQSSRQPLRTSRPSRGCGHRVRRRRDAGGAAASGVRRRRCRGSRHPRPGRARCGWRYARSSRPSRHGVCAASAYKRGMTDPARRALHQMADARRGEDPPDPRARARGRGSAACAAGRADARDGAAQRVARRTAYHRRARR